jgi:protein TonB
MIVAAAHLGAAAYLVHRVEPIPPVEAPPPSVMVELAPLPTPSAAPAPPEMIAQEPEPLPELAPAPAVALAKPPIRPKPPERRVAQQQLESPAPRHEPTANAAEPAPTASPAGAEPPIRDSTAVVPASPSYLGLLLSHLGRYKHYPRAAQLQHIQGTIYLRFTMDRSGNVLAYRIERSSGHGELDDAAGEMIKQAQPLPQLPPEMTQQQLELVVPVQFFLR